MPINQLDRQNFRLLFHMLSQYVVNQKVMLLPFLNVKLRPISSQVISQSQNQDIETSALGITKIPINSPACRQTFISHLGGAEMVINQTLHPPYLPTAEPQLL